MPDEVKTEAKESPTMPEVEAKEQPQVDPTSELRGMLEAQGITGPDDFSGLINELQTYKKGYGDSRNEIGEMRRELEELRAQVPRSQRRYRQPPRYNEFGEVEHDNQGVDLEELITRSVGPIVRNEVLGVVDELNKRQAEAAQKYYAERSRLESRPNWQKVQPHFDKALQQPAIATALQQGEMTLEGLYSRLNERYLLSQVDALIKSIPGDVNFNRSGDVSTQQNIPSTMTADQDRKEKIRKAKEDKDPETLLDNLLPDDDGIFRR